VNLPLGGTEELALDLEGLLRRFAMMTAATKIVFGVS
jgi:hypothetical protein